MIIHTTSAGTSTMGNKLEVMGNIQGYLEDECAIITDSFGLPVTGTETRVSAGNEAITFIANYMVSTDQLGRKENIIGWYHSHPGYGCFLSKIDIDTQLVQQTQGPFIAIVIDPIQTISSGKVQLGAFRCWPPGYKTPETSNDYITIPKEKIEDYGLHYNLYYELEVEYFKSSYDSYLLNLLWKKYWMNTLTSSPLLTNRNYFNDLISDISQKLEKVENDVGKGSISSSFHFETSGSQQKQKR